ncbi:hypothetical protein CPAR01_02864 [Colletotrichum paranaense]|uniref:Uncharacterized protein n=1 Tax=Colletotrichum paranaense TaxID=1914294 RepID=A0ABQ9T240_9PEZI|nr:uncharacterized protein CPAR01_02864 [Colletotrichum paranaense]KAK1545362.1 hypothetical protein CPAR01_02864 [Colletotrichum paranaense]
MEPEDSRKPSAKFLPAHFPSISSQVSIESSLARRQGEQGKLLPLGIGKRESRCPVGQSRLHWIHDAGKSKYSAVRRRSRVPILPPHAAATYFQDLSPTIRRPSSTNATIHHDIERTRLALDAWSPPYETQMQGTPRDAACLRTRGTTSAFTPHSPSSSPCTTPLHPHHTLTILGIPPRPVTAVRTHVAPILALSIDIILDVHLTCKPGRDNATILRMNVTLVPGQRFERDSGLARLVEVCGALVPASKHSCQDSIPERCDTADMPHSILHLWGQGACVNSTAVSSRPDHRSIRPGLAIWDVRGNRRERSLHRYNSAYAKASLCSDGMLVGFRLCGPTATSTNRKLI